MALNQSGRSTSTTSAPLIWMSVQPSKNWIVYLRSIRLKHWRTRELSWVDTVPTIFFLCSMQMSKATVRKANRHVASVPRYAYLLTNWKIVQSFQWNGRYLINKSILLGQMSKHTESTISLSSYRILPSLLMKTHTRCLAI